MHLWDWGTGARRRRRFVPPVSFAIPRVTGGMVVGQGRTVQLVDGPGSPPRRLVAVEDGLDGNRFNDAKCDSSGRLWAGTMSTTREPGVAGLYRIEPDGTCEKVLSGTTISNGLGWSGDGTRMFFIDSTTQRIDVFDVDTATGALSGRRTFAEIDPADGLPDGLAVDRQDGIWVALFGGGALRHFDADGTLDAVVALPVSNPTCPTFAGTGLDLLVVTTARHRLTPEQQARETFAGSLLGVGVDVPGRPAYRFAG